MNTRRGIQGIFLTDLKTKVAKFTPVELGITDAVNAEVLSPRISGLVVTLGHHLLEDNSSVILPEPEPAPPRGEGAGRGKNALPGERQQGEKK